MTHSITVRKTFKYRLYQNRRNRTLVNQIDIAGIIWNHVTALQRRYYRLTGGYVNKYRMMKHIARLRRLQQFAYWQKLDAQAVQDIVERHDRAYQRFFTYMQGRGPRHGRPSFKKVKKYSSFTLKQTSWKYLGGNRIRIRNHVYKFGLSRPVEGSIKTVTVKRDNLGRLWICFSVVMEMPEPIGASTCYIGGFDFGLKAFLTDHEGNEYHSPQFLKAELKEIARLNRDLSRKQKGSNNRHKAKRRLAKTHARIADKRRDAHWKLAQQLCARFDFICLEMLNLDGMKQLWGRKVSDLGFAEFVSILQQAAGKTGTEVVRVDQWLPTSKACARCGVLQAMPLSIRYFDCPDCGWSCSRDQNAALNILAAGASAVGLGEVRRS